MLEIRITAPELSEAINNLAKALTGGLCGCHQPGENNAHIENRGTLTVNIPEQEAPTPTVPVAPAVPVANPTPPVTAPQTVPTAPSTPPVSSPSPSVPTAAPQYTLEMIAKAGTALVDAGKLGEVSALLGKFGVDVLTALDPSMYGAFATELRALGAQI